MRGRDSPGDSAETSEGDETAGGLITADLCIIGAGSGGLSVAAAAASLGQKVVLIEKHKMGGDCLNYGCVPVEGAARGGQARGAPMRSSAAVRHHASRAAHRLALAFTTTCTASSPPSSPTISSSASPAWASASSRPPPASSPRPLCCRRASHHRPPLRHRHRLVTRVLPSRSRRHPLFHQRNHLRQQPRSCIISSSSAVDRSAWSWRRRISASAAASPSSKL